MSAYIKTIGGQKLTSDYNTEGKKLLTATDIENKQDKLTAGTNITIDENNVISSNDFFIAVYDVTTYQEIIDAYKAGKICLCRPVNGTDTRFLTYFTSSLISFARCDGWTQRMYESRCYADNTWKGADWQFQTKLTFDTVPTPNSKNPVTSDGIKTAINAKQDALTAGTGITIDENNVISASGSGTLFIAEYDVTSFADVQNAINNGQVVMCKYANSCAQLIGYTNALIAFSRTYIVNETVKCQIFSVASNGSWSTQTA